MVDSFHSTRHTWLNDAPDYTDGADEKRPLSTSKLSIAPSLFSRIIRAISVIRGSIACAWGFAANWTAANYFGFPDDRMIWESKSGGWTPIALQSRMNMATVGCDFPRSVAQKSSQSGARLAVATSSQ